VTGVEIVPLAKLDRPRVDVTLRISGLFRDAFPMQLALFDSAVRAIAERDESEEWNPLAAERRRDAPIARIFGNAPGEYGTGAAALIDRGAWQARAELGAAYLQASGFAYGRDAEGTPDHAGFAARLAAADAFVHPQDHAETDLLDSPEYAAHEGGLAAAADSLGNRPALYHADTSRPDAPRIRALSEEVARAVRGRAANPRWIAGMMRHGYRGAAEIARSVEGLFGFAATVPHRFDAQFELLYTATLGDAEVDEFLRANNSAARAAMVARFREAVARRLWHPRRNDFAADEAPR
jgi:cobaltochelatase CobN